MGLAAMAAIHPSLLLQHWAGVQVVNTTATTPQAAAQEGAVSTREHRVHQVRALAAAVDTQATPPLIRAAAAEGRQHLEATAQVVVGETVEMAYTLQ